MTLSLDPGRTEDPTEWRATGVLGGFATSENYLFSDLVDEFRLSVSFHPPSSVTLDVSLGVRGRLEVRDHVTVPRPIPANRFRVASV